MKAVDLNERLRKIKVVVTDVDGVLTDGGMYYGAGGDEIKKFNVRDGAGVALLKLAGIRVGAITGENISLVERRMRKIGANFLYVGVRDKLACVEKAAADLGVSPDEIAYVGDEINDYALLGGVGVFFAVADANSIILSRADHVLKTKGGEGALREVCERILHAQEKAEEALAAYVRNSREESSAEQPGILSLDSPRAR
jgi:YrbI family 3-deoxy-D-manno-octulosonate 8-phosphate phosphatase